jgi:two-component system, NarL family, response regulator DevR
MNEIRVGLVDDHSIVRQGLRAMLDRQPDLRVVGEAASAAAALAMVAQARPDVVLLDLKLSAGSDREGLQVCRRDRALSGQPGSGTDDIRGRMAGPRGHQAGREGFLVKDVELTELVRGIRAVHRSEGAFDSRSASVVVHWMHGQRGPGAPAQQITPGSGKSSPCSPAG